MDDQSFYNRVALIAVTVLLGAFGVGYFGATMGGHSSPAATSSTSAGVSPTIYMTISTLPNGADQYLPGNFSVPAGIPVHFVISSFDNGTNLLTPAGSTVRGTLGGTESIAGGVAGTPQGAVSSLPKGATTHTFTIMSGGMDLNVVIPPSADGSTPVVVTFSVTFSSHGSFSWLCLAPCDPNSMSSMGYMSGTLTVA